jgi:membrane protein DedA with SNARE-associated domain
MLDALPGSYWTVFLLLVGAGVGLPVPEELPVLAGGLLVGRPEAVLHWWIMLPLCVVGVVVSDGLLYGVGRWWGRRLLGSRWIASRLSADRLHRIQDDFRTHGVKILLCARFLPGVRSPIFIAAGILRMPFGLFVLADGLYAVPGVSLIFLLGYLFTDQILGFAQRIAEVKLVVAGGLLIGFGYFVVRYFRTGGKQSPGTAVPGFEEE